MNRLAGPLSTINAAPNSAWVPEHWNVLQGLPYVAAGAVGIAPSAWVEGLQLIGVPDADQLPQSALDRAAVRQICRDTNKPVLFGYACGMAWGGQGLGPTRPHAQSAWAAHADLKPILELLRTQPLNRVQAYELFLNGARIPGLGPSFWTKLLFFFAERADLYVMDQWVAKSVNLLVGRPLVPLVGGCPPRDTPSAVYNTYCEEIDHIANHLGLSGSQAEEKMMSHGGHKPGAWRSHVLQNEPKNGSQDHS
ncbi:MAG: hypothetical protein RIS24_3451 [Verrucomicrobiota bacterium]